MKTYAPWWLVFACMAWSCTLMAQEAHKGRSEARTEMSRQISHSGAESFETRATREGMARASQMPLMTPMQSTEAFLSLDINGDMRLSRSEIPAKMPVLRAQFERYDINGDHRLTYSEFANYTDVVPNEMAKQP